MVLDNVSIGYGSRTVASGISFSIGEGRLGCLIGRNGCGKSTLLKTVAMLQKPLSGKITYKGRNLAAADMKRLSRTIGIVLTGHVEAENLTVKELVAAGRAPYTGFFGNMTGEDDAAVRHSLDLTGISSLAGRRVSTLSDGEYQKAVVAKTLAQQTPVILLDEPTAFLDYAGKVDLMHTIKRLCREERKTVLMSTHDVNLAMRMADDIFFMADGRLWRSGSEGDVRRFVGKQAAAFL